MSTCVYQPRCIFYSPGVACIRLTTDRGTRGEQDSVSPVVRVEKLEESLRKNLLSNRLKGNVGSVATLKARFSSRPPAVLSAWSTTRRPSIIPETIYNVFNGHDALPPRLHETDILNIPLYITRIFRGIRNWFSWILLCNTQDFTDFEWCIMFLDKMYRRVMYDASCFNFEKSNEWIVTIGIIVGNFVIAISTKKIFPQLIYTQLMDIYNEKNK